MQNNKDIILNSKNIYKSMIILALPIMFSNVLKSIHDIVDMYFISSCDRLEEEISAMISAITVVSPIFMIFQALAFGLMVAGVAIMGQYIGRGKIASAKKVSGQLLVLCIIIGFCLNALLYFLTPSILTLMGADEKPLLFEYAKSYVQIRSFELSGLFIFFSYQASRQARGDTFSPVILNVVSVLVNIILTALFILVFDLDIKGAAIATVIGNMIIVPFCIILLFKQKDKEMRLTLDCLKFDSHKIKKLFIIGTPSAIAQGFSSLGFLIINSMMLQFSEVIISAIGTGNRINSLLLFPAMAIGNVLATFISQNIGAENKERAKLCVKKAMILSLVIVVIGSSVLMMLREPLAMFFLKKTPDAVSHCVDYLFFLLVGLPLMGIFQVFLGAFQGSAKTDFALILTSTRLWILRIPVIWLFLKLGLEEKSVWYAMSISNFGAAILGLILYFRLDFKPRITKMKKRLMKEGVS